MRSDYERRLLDLMSADAHESMARYRCPRCRAAEGEVCRWRQRPQSPYVHAPRVNLLMRDDRK